jgi:sarcosine oxidase subunit gamma
MVDVAVAARRSPLQSLASATTWPELFAGNSVSMREIPFVSQVNLRVDPASAAADRVPRAIGVALPLTPNRVANASRWSALWLGPDEWLVVGPDGDAPAIEASLREALGTDWGSVVDVSANRTVIELSGPAARMVLAKGCPLDLHPRQFGTGSCAQSLLAKALVMLWRRDDEPTYWIFVRASFAVYVAEWLLDALVEFRSRAQEHRN